MAKQEKRLNLNRLKGWIGYVRSYNNLVKQHDKVKWGEGRVKPEVVKKTPFKTTYKFK